MYKPFVPDNFIVPEKTIFEKFILRPLKLSDADKDFKAVLSSLDHLQGTFGQRDPWPSKNILKEQELIDLGWHQKEFQMRDSFTYTVFDKKEENCLGCVYLFPSRKENYDAEIYLWVRKTEYDKGLDTILFNEVKKWINEKWPFKKVAYPGRDIDWNLWNSFN